MPIRIRLRALRTPRRTLHSGAGLFAILVASALVTLAGCSRFDAEGKVATPDPEGGALADAPPVLVHVAGFSRGAISSVLKVHAKLEAVEEADVVPEISGVVAEVLAREGDRVAQGQPVVRLVTEEYQLNVDIKKVLWDQAKSKVRQSDLAAREQEKLAATKRLLEQKAKAEYDRIAELYSEEVGGASTGIISKEEFDARKYAWEQAKIDVETAGIQAEKAVVDHTLAQQNERQAELEYNTSKFQLARATLRSPIDGEIAALELKRGELVGPSTVAFSVVNPDKLEAKLFVPQRELRKLQVGQPVTIDCEVFPDERFAGVVEVINPVVDLKTGMVRVIVGVTDPTRFLRPGLFINGQIVFETRENALLVSKKAILYDNQQPILFLVEEGVARRYVVRPGESSESSIEVRALEDAAGQVRETVADDAVVVTQGHSGLQDGSRVEVDAQG